MVLMVWADPGRFYNGFELIPKWFDKKIYQSVSIEQT